MYSSVMVLTHTRYHLNITDHAFVGERTPVGIRMADPPASIPEHWLMCKTGRQFRSAVASYGLASDLSFVNPEYAEGEYMTIKRIVERSNGVGAEGEWYVLICLFVSLRLTFLDGAASLVNSRMLDARYWTTIFIKSISAHSHPSRMAVYIKLWTCST